MASLTPLSESVPSAAVEPLTLAMAPKLIGLPAPMTTHPNLSALHLSVPPLLEVFALPPQAAATMTRTAPRTSPVRILRFFMFPPRSGGPQSLNRTPPRRVRGGGQLDHPYDHRGHRAPLERGRRMRLDRGSRPGGLQEARAHAGGGGRRRSRHPAHDGPGGSDDHRGGNPTQTGDVGSTGEVRELTVAQFAERAGRTAATADSSSNRAASRPSSRCS